MCVCEYVCVCIHICLAKTRLFHSKKCKRPIEYTAMNGMRLMLEAIVPCEHIQHPSSMDKRE